jgi:uncharacterized protein YbjT (DUF2867 family)
MRVLVTGISGYVGATLAPRLLRDGHELRGMSRHPRESELGIPVLEADAVSGAGLEQALDGVDVAYYLIHSMEASSANGAFDDLERRSAENFARVAQAAGVERVIYLGGLIPVGGPRSRHLTSRLEVERVLLQATPASVAFRASIVIGARSASFRFLVKLVERLPVLVLPGWHTHRTNPIDERDIIELLARAATSDAARGQSLDAGGRDVVTYGELIDRIRDLMLVGRPKLAFERLTVTPIASRVASKIASEDYALIGPLMESLEDDLLPRDDRAASLLGVRLHSLDSAIERSLRQWERFDRLAAR